MRQAILIGNPNCGKTTLFNALTGENQRVGNWSGVTVEKKTGLFMVDGETLYLTDLPGVYSLSTPLEDTSADALITAQAVARDAADLVINVVDACHLERHLYLTSQVLELGLPMVVVLTMVDLAQMRGILIDTTQLAAQLGCPVVEVNAHRHEGIASLSQLGLTLKKPANPLPLRLPETVQALLEKTTDDLYRLTNSSAAVPSRAHASFLAYRLLEGATWIDPECCSGLSDEVDFVMADARYHAIHALVQQVQKKASDARDHLTARLDRWVLHRVFALPIFLCIMYLMFWGAIRWGSLAQDYLAQLTEIGFVEVPQNLLQQWHTPSWLTAILTHGLGKGLQTTLTFIPVMAIMYFFLSMLETSGYMARAAFVVDKLMRLLGLPGQSFVPMIVGFGCNVPAIMAARTMSCERERRLTILMAPFMSCSARLAIYAAFVAQFFPNGGQHIVFSLYLVGILMAIFTGYVLRHYLFKGQSTPLLLELPAYHRPVLSRLLKETGLRLRYFIWRAGRFIVPICMMLAAIQAISVHGESLLSWIGHYLTPWFAPMGSKESNWPATVGLLTGALAKEVVVGTLNSLYATLGHSILATMAQQFDGKIGAYAYLLFILLYIPCVSTMAVIRQESNRRLMWLSISWSLMVAYSVSVLFYQVATWARHPQQTLEWLLGFVLLFGSVWLVLRHVSRGDSSHVITAS